MDSSRLQGYSVWTYSQSWPFPLPVPLSHGGKCITQCHLLESSHTDVDILLCRYIKHLMPGEGVCICNRFKNVDIWQAGDETGVKQVEMFWNNLSFTNSPVSVRALPEALRANELKTLLPHWTNFEALCLTLSPLSSPLCFCWGGHVLQVKKVGWAVWVFCCCQNTRFKDRQQWHGDKECLHVLIFCNICIFSKIAWIVMCSLLWKHSPLFKIHMILFVDFFLE